MGRIGPNEVRGGPNRVSAQRRRRLCRALRGALCGGLREGVREVVWMCGGVECVGTGRVAGRLRGECCGGECCGGRAIGMEGGRGAAADGVAGRRGAGVVVVVVVVVVVSCGWPLAGLLRGATRELASCGDCCGVGCGSGCFGEGMLRGRNASGGGMRGDCRFCCGMGRRMDVEELTGRRGFCPRGGLSGWKADGAQRRKGRS